MSAFSKTLDMVVARYEELLNYRDDEIEEKTSEVAGLRERIGELNEAVESEKSEVYRLIGVVNFEVARANGLEKRLGELNEQAEDESQRVAGSLNVRIEQLEVELSAAKSRKSYYDSELLARTQEVKDARARAAGFEQQLNSQNRDILRWQEREKELTSTCEILEIELGTKKSDAADLAARLKNQVDVNKSLVESGGELMERLKSVTAQNQNLVEENSTLLMEREKLKEWWSRDSNLLKQAGNEIAAANRRADRLQGELDEATELWKTRNSEAIELTAKANKLADQCVRLTKKLEALEK